MTTYICWLMSVIVAVRRSDAGCETRLDVVSEDQWPILQQFRQEQLNMGNLLSVSDSHVGTQALLFTWENNTLVYPDPFIKDKYGISAVREILEIKGRALTDIRFGWDFNVILTEGGAVWTAGRNEFGQLSWNTTDRPIFTEVLGVPSVMQIAVGYGHVVVLTNDGELFSWGYGLKGELGYCADEINPTPRHIKGVKSSNFVCCSYSACMALSGDSEVVTWGSSYHIGRSGHPCPPALVSGIPSEQTIVKVSCGDSHMVALSSSGRLYGWGSGGSGEILQAPAFVKQATELDLGGKVVRDVVAGRYVTIIRTDTDDVYYFGYHNGSKHHAPQLANSTHTPRDLMARGYWGQETYGAVKLGCKANPF